MKGRAFLELAQDRVRGTREVDWRATAVHAYYALMLECRDAQVRWGFPLPPRQSVHAVVRLRFVYASDPDLQRISRELDWLVRLRNQASYDLRPLAVFASAAEAQQAIQRATVALALLDAIEADPARLAAARAAIRP